MVETDENLQNKVLLLHARKNEAVKKKKNIDMAKAMRAFIKYNEDAGHKFPIDYVIK